MSAADALAILRALAAIPIVWAIAVDEQAIAFALFVLAGLTDVLDGWLARRAGSLGARGAFLDPLADKILVVSTLVALATAGSINALLVAAVAARELFVLALRARAFRAGLRLPAGPAAKLKTACEMTGAALVIGTAPPMSSAGVVLVLAALVIGIATVPHYLGSGTRRIA